MYTKLMGNQNQRQHKTSRSRYAYRTDSIMKGLAQLERYMRIHERCSTSDFFQPGGRYLYAARTTTFLGNYFRCSQPMNILNKMYDVDAINSVKESCI